MFKTLRPLINLLVVILLLHVLQKLIKSLVGKMPELGWASPMLILLGVLFILEVWRWLLGHKIMWRYFSPRDRIVFFVSLTEVMLISAIVEKLQTPWLIDLLVGLAGLVLGWLIIRLFGSSEMEKAIRMPLPLLQRNANEEISR